MTELPPINKQEDLKRLLSIDAYYAIPAALIFFFMFAHWAYSELKLYSKGGRDLSVIDVIGFIFIWFFVTSSPCLYLVAAYDKWKDKWKIIEDTRRRKYAHYYRIREPLYPTTPANAVEIEQRRQFLNQELATLTEVEKWLKPDSWKEDSKKEKGVWPMDHFSHVMAEFTDAKALITKELATLERLALPVEETHVIVAPAPVATQKITEETGLERY